MKLFSAFTSMVAANNMMLPLMLMGDDLDSDSMKNLMIMNSMGLSQNDPMTQLLPLMLLGDSSSSSSSTSTTSTSTSSDDLMLLMMMNPSAINDPNTMLPFLLMDDSIDMTNMFLMTSMMQKDCSHDTNEQMNMMLPLLMDSSTSDDEMMKTLLMFQMMSPNASGLDMNSILPMLMLENDSSDSMMLILLSNMAGVGSYENNFNMMLPLLMEECANRDTVCEKENEDLMIMMMMMSSQSPQSGTSVQSILPMLLMKDDSNNQTLMMFMMMNQANQCLPIVKTQQAVVEPKETEQVIYRTWRLNADGTKTLISEE